MHWSADFKMTSQGPTNDCIMTCQFALISGSHYKVAGSYDQSMNKNKTNVMLFCGSRSKHRNNTLNVHISPDSEEMLTQVAQVKYLGIELDEYLQFDCHIDKLCRTVKARAGVVWRMCSFISESLGKHLFH